MLTIAGLGLRDGDVSDRTMKSLEKCDEAYAEFYTNVETVDVEVLEEQTGQDIKKLSREEVEREQLPVVQAEDKHVVFLVSGDPLSATTHFELKKQAEERKIEVEVCHAPSILTAVAETGLNLYKFGRTVTIPEKGEPESVKSYIEQNESVGLHTLVLLDIGMDASTAAEKLLRLGVEDRKCVVAERLGLESQKTSVLSLKEVQNKDLGGPPHSIILPGKMSHKEKEYVDMYE